VTTAIVAGLLAGWAIAVPVGAIAAYLVGLTARTSLRVGAAAALGVATVDGGYALVAVLGGHSLVHFLDPITRPLRIVAAIVLAVVAARGIIAAFRHHRSSERDRPPPATGLRPGNAYVRLIGLTMVNPATVVYFAAVVIGSRVTSSLSLVQGLAFAAAAFAASASWQLTLAGGGAALGRVLTGARGRLITALASGAVIAAFAVVLGVSALS
jgi:arginine exporter protein ArgO